MVRRNGSADEIARELAQDGVKALEDPKGAARAICRSVRSLQRYVQQGRIRRCNGNTFRRRDLARYLARSR